MWHSDMKQKHHFIHIQGPPAAYQSSLPRWHQSQDPEPLWLFLSKGKGFDKGPLFSSSSLVTSPHHLSAPSATVTQRSLLLISHISDIRSHIVTASCRLCFHLFNKVILIVSEKWETLRKYQLTP